MLPPLVRSITGYPAVLKISPALMTLDPRKIHDAVAIGVSGGFREDLYRFTIEGEILYPFEAHGGKHHLRTYAPPGR